jgi:hypothetical protein
MMKCPAFTTAGKDETPGLGVVLDIQMGWNPFGCIEPIEEYLKQVASRRTFLHYTDETLIRFRALYGVFRSANIGKLGERITDAVTWRGLILYLWRNNITTSLITVGQVDMKPVTEDKPFLAPDQRKVSYGGNAAGPDFVPIENFPAHIVEYVARSVMGDSFEGLPRISRWEIDTVYRAAMACTIKGEKGENYKKLRRFTDDMSTTTKVRLATRGYGIPSTVVTLGDIPVGVEA